MPWCVSFSRFWCDIVADKYPTLSLYIGIFYLVILKFFNLWSLGDQNFNQLISLSFYPPLSFTPPLWVDDLKQGGGKNSRITAGGGQFLRIFAVKSFRNTLFLVVKTQKHTQKVLKLPPTAVERRKNILFYGKKNKLVKSSKQSENHKKINVFLWKIDAGGSAASSHTTFREKD